MTTPVRADNEPEAAAANEAPAGTEKESANGPELSPEQMRKAALYRSIAWVEPPNVGKIGDVGEIKLPAGYRFTGRDGAAKYMELCENPANPQMLAVLMPDDGDWFLTFTYQDIGHVPDDEKTQLDADSLMSTFRAGEAQSNAERRRLHFPEMHIVDWLQKPAYDPTTNNLIWALNIQFDQDQVANYDMRLLGRTGVMSVQLVSSPQDVPQLTPKMNSLLTGYSFTDGNKYAEFRAGDKVAEYGLTGLIAGGAVVAAAKTGLLAKLGLLLAKGGKAIIVAVLAVGAAVWKGINAIFGRKSASAE